MRPTWHPCFLTRPLRSHARVDPGIVAGARRPQLLQLVGGTCTPALPPPPCSVDLSAPGCLAGPPLGHPAPGSLPRPCAQQQGRRHSCQDARVISKHWHVPGPRTKRWHGQCHYCPQLTREELGLGTPQGLAKSQDRGGSLGGRAAGHPDGATWKAGASPGDADPAGRAGAPSCL